MFQVRDEQHRMIESNGDTLPQLKEIFSDQPIYRRTGIINCCEDPSFRSALEDLLANIGRTHVIISRVTIGTCCSMPTLAMRHDGYPVFPVIDACGARNTYEADAATSSMARTEAQLVTVFALGCELRIGSRPQGTPCSIPSPMSCPNTAW
jgi:nicotinamidase-related amidase